MSSIIDIYRLKLELADHPDRNFVFNLLTTLKEGARIGYSGPRSVRVSPYFGGTAPARSFLKVHMT